MKDIARKGRRQSFPQSTPGLGLSFLEFLKANSGADKLVDSDFRYRPVKNSIRQLEPLIVVFAGDVTANTECESSGEVLLSRQHIFVLWSGAPGKAYIRLIF
jgi:hypothetical protein